MILSITEAHFSCLKPFLFAYLRTLMLINYNMFMHESESVCSLLYQNWSTSHATDSHVCCKSRNISETVQDRDVVTKDS